MKKIVAIALLAFSFNLSNAQVLERVEPGVSGIYNFQSGGIGIGVRAVILINSRIDIVPQYNIYPGFNRYNEYYIGGALHYNFFATYDWKVYGLLAGSYNNWKNSEEYSAQAGIKSNLAIEPGIGIVRDNSCLKPFAEARYNVDWKEFNVRVGVLFNIFYCYFGNAGRRPECGAYK